MSTQSFGHYICTGLRAPLHDSVTNEPFPQIYANGNHLQGGLKSGRQDESLAHESRRGSLDESA